MANFGPDGNPHDAEVDKFPDYVDAEFKYQRNSGI